MDCLTLEKQQASDGWVMLIVHGMPYAFTGDCYLVISQTTVLWKLGGMLSDAGSHSTLENDRQEIPLASFSCNETMKNCDKQNE
jgi:hypothetical protein